MDRRGLRDALLAAGVPEGAFQLPGVHESTPVPTDFWFLRRTGSGWEIGSHERGRDEVRERFATEHEACVRLYAVLTGEPAPPGGDDPPPGRP